MRRLITVIAVVAGLAVMTFAGVRSLSVRQTSTPQYAYAPASYGELLVTVTGHGTVEAATTVSVNAQEPGTITSVPVQVGNRVSQGQVLAYASDTQGTLKSSLLSAQAQLKADQVSLQQLAQPTPPSAVQVQAAKQRIQVDEDNIRNYPDQIAIQQQRIVADRKKVQTDQQNIGDLTVTSPVVGLLSTVSVSSGQQINQGATLFQVMQPSSIDVTTSVPEIALPSVYVGEGVQVWTQDQGTMQAAISSIGLTSNGSSSQGALFPVTLTIENPPSGLRSGMEATANFLQNYLTEPGTVAFADVQTVTAQVSGTVTSVTFAPGQAVKPGDTVLTLSNPSLQTQLTQDQTQLSSDEAQLGSDKTQLISYEAQLSSDQASLNSLLHPTPPSAGQIASLKARLSVDQMAVQQARQALAALNITSPITGILTAVNAKPGMSTTSGGGSSTSPVGTSSALFALENPSTLQVQVPINELSIAQVKAGQPAQVTSNALPGTVFNGTVAVIAPAGVNSQGVATFNVTISVDKPGALRAGMSAKVSILVAQVKHALLVPVEAVQGSGDQASVQLRTKHGVAQTDVTVGLTNNVSAQVLSGLKPGQQVVTASVASQTPQNALSGWLQNANGGGNSGGGGQGGN